MDPARDPVADGWAEIEDSVATTELPPVPPTSDPERLLRYVLQIQPKYTEMEMMATHLRLYVTSLEQDLEQARNHSRILSSEVATEREKKQFLERYAAQVVKERNELLHARSAKKAKSSGSSHFTWHACCKKSGEHVADVMPSMAAFRGDKLQEAMGLMRSLQDEVRNQERLRQEVNFMLKRTHREHDSKSAADRKHIQQLEKQLVQRAMLQSTLERKLYEVESALARYDSVKLREISDIEKKLEEANARVSSLEAQCERYQVSQHDVEAERDDLQDRLTHVMVLKDELADQVDQLSTELGQAQADVEALRGEVEVLQSEDVTSLKALYEGKVEKQQEEWSNREHDLMVQIDKLRQELRKNEVLLQRATVHVEIVEDTYSNQSSPSRNHDSWARQRAEWLHEAPSPPEPEEEHVGSSLSRSQLSRSAFSDSSDDDFLPLKRDTGHGRRDSRRFTLFDALGELHGYEDVFAREVPLSISKDSARKPNASLHKSKSFSRSSLSTKRHESQKYISGTENRTIADPSNSPTLSRGLLEDEDENKSDQSDEYDTNLLSDMQTILKQFQDRRIEEEQKAQDAEKALADYHQGRDQFRNMLAPIA